jgi:hypothetical protein
LLILKPLEWINVAVSQIFLNFNYFICVNHPRLQHTQFQPDFEFILRQLLAMEKYRQINIICSVVAARFLLQFNHIKLHSAAAIL